MGDKMKSKCIFLCSILVLFCSLKYGISAQSYYWSWSNSQINKIKNARSSNSHPEIASFNKNIHIVWQGYPNIGGIGIFYTKSIDDGKTWSNQTKLCSGKSSKNPKIAISQNRIHVVWSKDDVIYYRRSTNRGDKWRGILKLSEASSECSSPNIAVFNEKVYVVWAQEYYYPRGLYFIKSDDNGINWSKAKRLSKEVKVENPSIAVYQNKIHVVWEDLEGIRRLFYRKSNTYGNTWQNRKRLDYATYSSYEFIPDIAVDKNNVHVVWINTDFWGGIIRYKKGTNGGNTWLGTKNMNKREKFKTYRTYKPSIAAKNKRVYIVWDESGHFSDYDQHIFYRESLDNGISWADEVSIAYHPYNHNPRWPSISATDKIIRVVYNMYFTTWGRVFHAWKTTGI